MPQRKPTPEEAQWYKDNGYNPDEITITEGEPASEEVSNLSAAGRTLRARAGGIAGGGAGALGTGAALSWLLGPEVGLPVTLLAGAAGALGGGYVGQKTQEAIQGKERTKKYEEAYEQARQQHPLTVAATDIGASALASGGSFSPGTAINAGRGLIAKLAGKELTEQAARDLGNVAIQSTINPAINTGIQYATTGQLPSLGDLAEQTIGGALFAKPSRLGLLAHRLGEVPTGHIESGENVAEPTESTVVKNEANEIPRSPFEMRDEAGKYHIADDQLKNLFMQGKAKKITDLKGISDESERYLANIENAKSRTFNKSLLSTAPDEMRRVLTEEFIKKQTAEPTPEPTKKGIVVPTEETLGPKLPSDVTPTQRGSEYIGPGQEAVSIEDQIRRSKLEQQMGKQSFLESERRRVEAEQRLEEFKKAKEEESLQNAGEVLKSASDEMTPKPETPWTENQKRILGTEEQMKSILPSSVDRPESFDRNKYAPPSEQRTTEQQRDLLRRFYETAQEIQNRTKLGLRKVTATEKSFVASWSNASNRWGARNYIPKSHIPKLTGYESPQSRVEWEENYGNDQRRNFLKKGEETELDSNEVLLPAKTQKEGMLMLEHLPPLPLYGNAHENNPLSKIGKQEVSIKDIQDFYDKMSKGQNLIKSDVPEYVSKFMDKIRSPEQSQYSPPSDYQRYNEIQQQMRAKMAKGELDDEFHKLWKESEVIKNKNGGIPPSKDVQNAPWSNKEYSAPVGKTVGEELENLKKHPEVGVLAKALNIDKQSLAAKIDSTPINDLPHYSPDKDTIYLGNNTSGRIRLHEIVHAATTKKLYSLEDNHPVKQEINSLFEEAKQHLSPNEHYGMTNVHEFVAEALTGTKFQKALNNIQTKSGSIWSRLVDAIRKLLGIDVKQGSMLERVLKPIDELTQMERPSESGPTIGKHYAPSESVTIPEEMKKQGFSFAPFLAGRYDKIAAKFNTPTAKMVTEQFHKFHGEMDRMIGQIGNKLIQITKPLKGEQIDKVYQYLHDIDNDGKSSIKLSAAEQSVASQLTKSLQDIRQKQIESGPKIRLKDGTLRTAGIKDEGYMFNILDSQVAHEWANNDKSAKAKAYDKAYIEHLVSKDVTPEEARQTLHDYKLALDSDETKDIEFGAIRKAEGKGLPWELVDKNFGSSAIRYGSRAARDLAYFKHIQSIPEMRKALNLNDEAGNRTPSNVLTNIDELKGDEVKAAMRSVWGVDHPRNPELMAWARAAGNTVMGAGTAARNLATVPAIAAAYVQVKQLPLFFKAFAKMNESRIRAFENNAVKVSFADYDAAGYVKNDPNPVINLLNKYSSFMRKYQGRDFSDKFEGEYYYSLGEQLAVDNIARAKTGNIESKYFLRRFGDIVDGGADRLINGKVTQDDISRVAKRFVDAARGTYGPEGLPSWAIEGEIAPFTALSRFSIEKANTVYKDVIMPMKEGNYGPMFRYALASLGVGIGIEKLNELLSNKRGPDATVNETLAHMSPENATAKAIGLFQLASFAGIIGDSAKLAMQAYKGKELRYNQPLSFPLYSMVTDTLAGNIGDAISAIKEGQDPFDVMGMLVTNIAGQSVQTARYMENHLNPKDTERKEKFRDISVFNELEGQSPKPIVRSNEYMDADAKKFKRSGDAEEATSMLPELVRGAIEKSKGDPFELQKRLRSLKANNYQTMPNYETMPLAFARYISHLQKTQGIDAANTRLMDYLNQNFVNKMKSSAVP